jgi:hypothetical protein
VCEGAEIIGEIADFGFRPAFAGDDLKESIRSHRTPPCSLDESPSSSDDRSTFLSSEGPISSDLRITQKYGFGFNEGIVSSSLSRYGPARLADRAGDLPLCAPSAFSHLSTNSRTVVRSPLSNMPSAITRTFSAWRLGAATFVLSRMLDCLTDCGPLCTFPQPNDGLGRPLCPKSSRPIAPVVNAAAGANSRLGKAQGWWHGWQEMGPRAYGRIRRLALAKQETENEPARRGEPARLVVPNHLWLFTLGGQFHQLVA